MSSGPALSTEETPRAAPIPDLFPVRAVAWRNWMNRSSEGEQLKEVEEEECGFFLCRLWMAQLDDDVQVRMIVVSS